ncbi:arrestin domain-containing protein 3-like isoform X1 [Branchiostoma floridae]|uniref:Arrestin domain-containing protein 3-like isoform X1 n=1 Tax=Branchiostoma floridae TaxID=7739 RepID=A0A9J7LRN0_BRAFL|nr:arrestin domain-containing protein 3-like isoform X1 [Branchiostoma floridae]XP_035687009.1 arrestin domain-containing protein 3-like isoform X1 [Branchiostoma floridae]XP_035687017.1 arrestin domain-containing protein 3-like isoform X1 [Branchiostoma floridae]XP_035687025.1 arrestin domain-containing protein 3-like isoform X1 [Branchiostoma floridae]
MGKIKQFTIAFEDGKDVFEAGECVKGHVVVELAEDVKMRGLWLLFHGQSEVEWREHGSDDSSVTYKSVETYFKHEVTLFGTAREQSSQGDAAVLPMGRHVFPFQYQLPAEELPCSFEGEHGYVRYIITATIDRPWKLYRTMKTSFTVLEKEDENSREDFIRTHPPDLCRATTTPGCLCCESGPVELQVQPDRTIYRPGDVIVIRGTVTNNSNVDVTSVEARLVQIATFHGDHETTAVFSRIKTKTKEAKKVVQQVQICGCKRGESLTFSVDKGAALRVPPIPPSALRFCRIIDLEYRLDVVPYLEGAYSYDLKTQIPVKIGPYRRHPHNSAHPPCAAPPAAPGPPVYTIGPAVITQPTSVVPSAPDLDLREYNLVMDGL